MGVVKYSKANHVWRSDFVKAILPVAWPFIRRLLLGFYLLEILIFSLSYLLEVTFQRSSFLKFDYEMQSIWFMLINNQRLIPSSNVLRNSKGGERHLKLACVRRLFSPWIFIYSRPWTALQFIWISIIYSNQLLEGSVSLHVLDKEPMKIDLWIPQHLWRPPVHYRDGSLLLEQAAGKDVLAKLIWLGAQNIQS